MGIVVDTCIWIGLADEEISFDVVADKIKGATIYCSVITLGELAFGIAAGANESTRAKRQRIFTNLATAPTMTIAPTTAEIFGRLSATVKRQGRNPRTRYHDLWLAAQAIEAGYSLLTANAADFIGLPDLQLLTL